MTNPTAPILGRPHRPSLGNRCPNSDANPAQAVIEVWQNYVGEHAEYRRLMGDVAGPPHARITIEHSCGWSASLPATAMSWAHLADVIREHFGRLDSPTSSTPASLQHEDQGAIAPARVLAGLAVLEWPDDRTSTALTGVHYQVIEAVIRAADRAGGRDHQCDPIECTCELTAAAPTRRHVLVVADNGTWTIEHPDDCTVATPTGPALICPVHDLAAEQLPDVELPAGIRIEVKANDIGDRLLIGDRVETTGQCHCEDPAGRDYSHQPGTGRHCGPEQTEG